jgi:hypothetical protein
MYWIASGILLTFETKKEALMGKDENANLHE